MGVFSMDHSLLNHRENSRLFLGLFLFLFFHLSTCAYQNQDELKTFLKANIVVWKERGIQAVWNVS